MAEGGQRPQAQRRPLCERCARPLRVCVCALLPPRPGLRLNTDDTDMATITTAETTQHHPHPSSSRLRLLVLQTPAEAHSRSHITRTVPLLQLVLPDPRDVVVLTVGGGPRDDAVVAGVVNESGGRALVFYPQPGAKGLREAVIEGGGDDNWPLLLVFLDGTWEGARRLYTRTPSLHALPTVALPAYADPTAPTTAAAKPQESQPDPSLDDDEELQSWLAAPALFTIRKEPAPLLGKGGRSTAEAVALALALVPAPDVETGRQWRAAARAIRGVVQGANALQLGLMDPAAVRHRRERPGYVENLYGLCK